LAGILIARIPDAECQNTPAKSKKVKNTRYSGSYNLITQKLKLMSEFNSTDDYSPQVFSHWWLYLLFGLNLIFLSILIIIFPALLSLLVASFLMADGVILLVIAFNIWRLKRKWEKEHPGRRTVVVS
jgi:hypothetical protein